MDTQKNKAKKVTIVGQTSVKAIHTDKKNSFVNMNREEQESKLTIKGLKSNGDDDDPLINCLRKVSKRTKKCESNPYIKRPVPIRAESEVLKIDVITE